MSETTTEPAGLFVIQRGPNEFWFDGDDSDGQNLPAGWVPGVEAATGYLTRESATLVAREIHGGVVVPEKAVLARQAVSGAVAEWVRVRTAEAEVHDAEVRAKEAYSRAREETLKAAGRVGEAVFAGTPGGPAERHLLCGGRLFLVKRWNERPPHSYEVWPLALTTVG